MSERHVVELPRLGESVSEATVTRWIKSVGDPIAVGEAIVEVSTDKVDTEVESPHAGVLVEIAAAADQTVQVGEALAVISGAEAIAKAAPRTAVSQPEQKANVQSAPHSGTGRGQNPSGHAGREPNAGTGAVRPRLLKSFLSPLVRQLAGERGVDPAALEGTGRGGRVTKADVLSAWERPQTSCAAVLPLPAPTGIAVPGPPRAPVDQTRPLSRLRTLIAQRTVESLATSAQVTTVLEVDVSNIVRLRSRVRDKFSASEQIPLTYMPFFAKATIETLREFPAFNASLDVPNETVRYHAQQHLGIAVDTDRGLVAPVIRDAGDLNIIGLSRAIADGAARARSNSLRPDELTAGTFTLTDTGSRGALFDTPIINQPQVAILGTGAITKRPVVVTDEAGADLIAIRLMMYLSLTYDHRLIDGADAGRFLVAVKSRLEAASFGQELLGSDG